MGSTGEQDRKRRHFSTISPTAASAKKQPSVFLSEDKKLDAVVLQFQNQKLVQKLEAQKAECIALESKFSQLREKQEPYDNTLAVVNKSWEELVDELESCSIRTKDTVSRRPDVKHQSVEYGGASSSLENDFLSRLLETGATESSSAVSNVLNQKQEDSQTAGGKTTNILRNIIVAVDSLWILKDQLYSAVVKALPENGSYRPRTSGDLGSEVKNLRLAISDLHLKHKSLAREVQGHWDTDAKNKAELKRLRGELESTITELEESNCKLATLKAKRDAAKGAFFPVLIGNKPAASDRARDKQKDLQDMESTLKELLDQASSRLLEVMRLYEERTRLLKRLSDLQNTLRNVKCISSSQAYVLIRDQLSKAKAEAVTYQALYEKLQVEKDNISWREKEINIKNDIVDVFQQASAVAESRITELRGEINKQINEKKLFETKLEEASKEPGMKEIIVEFKALVSSFPENMGSMQTQLGKYKEAASDVHSLRAEVQFMSSVLDRKAKESESLSDRSAEQSSEIQTLQAVVRDLKDSISELNLILEMYTRESTDSRDILEIKNSECKAWAHVQSLNSALDEHNLELRVKTAIEAEGTSQQRLAAAEAEIAELRQKLEASKRGKSRHSDILKSKQGENETYVSEIETIGQAYDDMQTQNQHLLRQITERDDYNTKLVLEGVQARQVGDTLVMEKQTMARAIEHAYTSVEYCDMKAAKVDDQIKLCSEQVQKLQEDRIQSCATLERYRRRSLDVRKSSQQLRGSLEESHFKLDTSRIGLAELQIELEKERFERKRVEEELEVVRRKISRLRSHSEGSSIVEKLHEELKEYREIVKCSICLDRPKEVVITKCYHLFCNPCVHRILESRHRKCPVCSTGFGVNDVKPVYI